eukprot:4887975-Pleurochrysis_carterae.AAC.3
MYRALEAYSRSDLRCQSNIYPDGPLRAGSAAPLLCVDPVSVLPPFTLFCASQGFVLLSDAAMIGGRRGQCAPS